jgi:MFS family permease
VRKRTVLVPDITIVNVALPDIQRALNSSFSDLQWIVDAYALTLAAFLLTAGSLADMFGRRLLYLVGLVVFTFVSVLCGFAVGPGLIVVGIGLLVAAVVALVSGVVSLATIRGGDFARQQRPGSPG